MQNAEHALITYPTWKKYIVISCAIEKLRVKDKRHLFHVMRKSDELTHNTFFPEYGITVGQFAIWQILSENKRNRRSKVSETE